MDIKSFYSFVLILLISLLPACGGGGGGGSSPPPVAPTGVAASSGDGELTVMWNEVSGASSYNLYLASASGITKTNYASLPDGATSSGVTTPHIESGLVNGTTYYLVVTAVNAFGESIESFEVSTTLPLIPIAPTGVAVSSGDGELTVIWNDVSGATSYNLYLASASGVKKTNYASLPDGATSPGVTTPHIETGLVNGMTYYLVVTAVNADGESIESTEVSATLLHAPKGFTASTGNGQIILNWEPVTGATSYNLYQATEFGVTKSNYASLAGGAQTTSIASPYTVTNLVNGMRYSFVITAAAIGESSESLEISAVPENHNAWTWQKPKPQGSDLIAVDFVNATTGWAVGKGGTILHTIDSGVTWNYHQSGATYMLADVSAVDSMTAWAVGWETDFVSSMRTSILLKTNDGGNTWNIQASPSGIGLYGVEFVDTMTGWIAGDEIYKTTDGGATWNIQAAGTYGYKIDFVDVNTGWITSGNNVLSTADSGENWISQGLGNTLSDVDFVDNDIGWMSSSGSYTSVFATLNGGSTWGAQSVPLIWPETLQSIAFADTTTGWGVGLWGAIYSTVNGGASWFSQNSGINDTLHGAATAGTTHAWAVGDLGAIVNTIDGGTTWNSQIQDASPDLWAHQKVIFFDASNGWVLDYRGALRTIDGGINWTVQYTPPANTSLSDFSFIDKLNGWIVGATIQRTVDGGANWTTQTNDLTGVRGVSFVDSNNGWVVGYIGSTYGLIRATVDGGANWVIQNSGATSFLNDIEFADAQNGWVVGENGVIRHTTDGGVNWLNQISGITTGLNDIKAINASTAWAVGSNIILSTTNGGATWNTHVLDNVNLQEVCFTDALNGWVTTSSGGIIYATQNGGVTWEKLITPLSNQLSSYGIFFVDSTTGWLVGGNGILKTTTGGR